MVKRKIIFKLIIMLDLYIKILQIQKFNLIEFKASKITLKSPEVTFLSGINYL